MRVNVIRLGSCGLPLCIESINCDMLPWRTGSSFLKQLHNPPMLYCYGYDNVPNIK